MKLSLDEIRKYISKFLECFLFELLDDKTTSAIESGIKGFLNEVGIADSNIRSIILDRSTLRVNVKFNSVILDFYLGRAYE